MSDRRVRLELRVGPPGSEPGIRLAALVEFGRELMLAIREQSQAGDASDVEIVRLGEGGSTLVQIACERDETSEAIEELAIVLEGRPESNGHVAPTSYRRLHSAFVALKPVGEQDHTYVRRTSGRVPQPWSRVDDEALNRLVRAAAAGPAAPAMATIRAVGTITALDIDRRELQLRPEGGKALLFTWSGHRVFKPADDRRWQRAAVTGSTQQPGADRFTLLTVSDAEADDLDAMTVVSQSDQVTAIRHAVDAIASRPDLREAGWDTYAARPIDPGAARRAMRVLMTTSARFALAGKEMPIPWVAPLASGGIQLEWSSREAYFEVAIEEKGRLHGVRGKGDVVHSFECKEASLPARFESWHATSAWEEGR